MEGKLMIFAVFASLAQWSFALPSSISYGLSAEEVAVLDRITTIQKETVIAKYEAFNPIFDIIEKYAYALIDGLEDVSNDDSAKGAAALRRLKDGCALVVDAILIALEKESSPTVTEVGDKVNAILDESFPYINDALAFAAAGYYSTNQAQLENYRDTAREQWGSVIDAVYGLISTLLNTSDTEVQAVIELVHGQSKRNVENVADAVFNGITRYAAAVSAGKANVRLISEIEDQRRNALDGLRKDLESQFGILQAFYINSKSDQDVSLSALNVNQYTQIASYYRYQDEAQAIFDTIIAEVVEVHLNLSNSGEADFSPVDAAQALALAELTAGYEIVLDAILAYHPDATEAVAAAKTIFSISSPELMNIIFDAIRTAGNSTSNYSESIEQIEGSRWSVISFIDVFVGNYYALLRNNATYDCDSEVEFATMRELAIDQLFIFTNNIFNAIGIQAKLYYDNKATESDLDLIREYQATVYSALEVYTQSSAAAAIIVLKASNQA